MKRQGEDIINALGVGIILVLFILVFSSLYNNPSPQGNRLPSHELVQDSHNSQLKAVISNSVHSPAFQKNSLPQPQKLFPAKHKIISANHKTGRDIAVLQKAMSFSPPVIPCLYYYHLFPDGDEDPPVLS
jgi:zona occludens toxin (predicted ATPase)